MSTPFKPPRNIMSQNTVDSLLALSSGSNDTIELSETGQGEIPRKKDQAREFQKRIEAIDRDAKVKIAKLKRLLPHGADGEDAISIARFLLPSVALPILVSISDMIFPLLFSLPACLLV